MPSTARSRTAPAKPSTPPTGQGEKVFTVTGIVDDLVKVDGNHPLAGRHLRFDVEVKEVREATPEEIDHGHLH